MPSLQRNKKMGSANASLEEGESVDIVFQLDYKDASVKQLPNKEDYTYIRVAFYTTEGKPFRPDAATVDLQPEGPDSFLVKGDDMPCRVTVRLKKFADPLQAGSDPWGPVTPVPVPPTSPTEQVLEVYAGYLRQPHEGKPPPPERLFFLGNITLKPRGARDKQKGREVPGVL